MSKHPKLLKQDLVYRHKQLVSSNKLFGGLVKIVFHVALWPAPLTFLVMLAKEVLLADPCRSGVVGRGTGGAERGSRPMTSLETTDDGDISLSHCKLMMLFFEGFLGRTFRHEIRVLETTPVTWSMS